MKFAIALLVLTVTRYYGYYFMTGVPARITLAFSGMQQVALAGGMVYLLFKRVSDWRVAVLLLLSLFITVVESSLIAVCGSWYAFIYTGPPLKGDSCELMTGMTISKPLAYTLFTLAAIVLPRVWGTRWGTLR
jgi:hypothetical protein